MEITSDSKKPILLVIAPYHDFYGVYKNAVSHYFPLGLGYIAAYLESHGFNVEMLLEDGANDVLYSVRDHISRKDYLFVGISSMTSAFPQAVRIAKIVRQEKPGTPIVLGGAHVSGVGPILLNSLPDFDMLAIGEGELTALELAQTLAIDSKEYVHINGLVWRGDDGKVNINHPRDFHGAIEDFGIPARHLIDFKRFSVHAHVTAGGGIGATILTSRGCPFGCKFCSAHLTDGKKYRFRSVPNIIQELRHLKNDYGVSYVFLEDDTVTVMSKRLYDLCDAIRSANLDITFGCFSRVDVFDEETAMKMSQAGFRLVIFGIESGVPEVLARIGKGKGATIEKAKKAISLCAQYGMKSYASFVVGFPFETRKQIMETIRFGMKLNPSVLTFNPLVPFPGTPLFLPEKHEPKDEGGWAKFLTTDVPPFDMVPNMSRFELRSVINRAHLRFYLQPVQIYRMLKGISSFQEGLSLARAGFSVILQALSHSKGRSA